MHVLEPYKPKLLARPRIAEERERERESCQMEGFNSRVGGLMVLLIMTFMLNAECTLHRVGGGTFTWAPNINFTNWSSHENFYVGDWLYFGFDKHIYNVLEVNKTSYENCMDRDFIFNVTRGGRDVFNLTEAKTYFFLSGRGYCYKGMKVAVDVHQSCSFKAYANNSIVLFAMLIAAWAWTLHF